MADLHPPDAPIPSVSPLILPSAILSPSPATITAISSAPLPDNLSAEPTATATATATAPAPNLGAPILAPKRQRRPSVRLGDIGGDPTFDHSHYRRPKTSWRYHKDPSVAAKTSKTRPLTNLVNNGASSYDNCDFTFSSDPHDEPSNPPTEFANKKPKSKKPAKRARTNLTSSSSKFDYLPAPSNGGLGGFEIVNDIASRDDNDNENDIREFELEGSESPLRQQEQSPVNSTENLDMTTGLQFWDGTQDRAARVSESSRDHHEINGTAHNNEDEYRSNSVRDWLIELGLGRYAPVFEIHEVDDEVLPMLTLEDLKDMGINAVGSRRKMYTAIMKIRKGFS